MFALLDELLRVVCAASAILVVGYLFLLMIYNNTNLRTWECRNCGSKAGGAQWHRCKGCPSCGSNLRKRA
jgi:rubrerythrin